MKSWPTEEKTMSITRIVATALALATMACASRSLKNPFDLERPSPPGASALQVVNNNWATVVVYGLTGGQYFRLGTVETGMTETFRLPAVVTASGDLQLRAYALASRDIYDSGPITFAPGETIELVVESAIDLSAWYVYE
jgi:hypothetical protein